MYGNQNLSREFYLFNLILGSSLKCVTLTLGLENVLGKFSVI